MAMGKAWSSYDAMAWNRLNRMGARYVPSREIMGEAKIDGKRNAGNILEKKSWCFVILLYIYIYIYVFAWDEIQNE